MSIELELGVAWQEHVGVGPEAEHWFQSLLTMYRQPARHYHDVRHLAWVVRHIADIGGGRPLADLGAVVAAGFFHDAVYDPGSCDNERQSAGLAERALAEMGWDGDRIRRVATMVMATANHDAAAADLDTKVLLAADLAVLASEPARYADYARAVRREYAHLDEQAWRSGRAEVLRRLLARSGLFAPDLSLAGWEARARANMTAELAELV